MRLEPTDLRALVTLVASHYETTSSARTTSVTVLSLLLSLVPGCFIPTTLCGMERVVGRRAIAAASTTLHAWFYKQLPQPTSDDIEMRVCRDESANNENVAIELYVQ